MAHNWNDPSTHIEHIHIAEELADDPYTKEIVKRAGLPWHIVPTGNLPLILPGKFHEQLRVGKKHLFLCNNKGSFFKPCPGTLEYACCKYNILNIGMNCPMDCVYCILQAYLDHPWIISFMNVEKMYDELTAELSANPERFYRIGTGEFTDSLAIDRITGLNHRLVEFMGRQENVLFELKSKCTYIEPLRNLDHKGRTLLSWSLNSEAVVKKEELRASSIEDRLKAARQAAEWGYGLAFHFDPIVEHPNWREGYRATIDKLFHNVPKEAIVWISMGALRFLPALKEIANLRFPRSKMFFHEFVCGLDNKSRYFRDLREEMYDYIYTLLKERAGSDTCIYFCMESEEIWQHVMGFTPDDHGGIPAMLDMASKTFIAKH